MNSIEGLHEAMGLITDEKEVVTDRWTDRPTEGLALIKSCEREDASNKHREGATIRLIV